jgi:transcriptional regulator with XRE-family HTH domain
MGNAIVFFNQPDVLRFMSAIGDRIKGLRKARKLTQVQLAPQLGIDQSTLSDIERGAGFSALILVGLRERLSSSAQFIMRGGSEEELRESELLAMYRALGSTEQQDHLLAVARALAGQAAKHDRHPIKPREKQPVNPVK